MTLCKYISMALAMLLALSSCSGGKNSGTDSGSAEKVRISASAASGTFSPLAQNSATTQGAYGNATAQEAGSTATSQTAGQMLVVGEESEKTPDIHFLSKGNILPSTGTLDLLFSSVSYAKAQVRIRKIYQSNILQYMQYDKYDSRSNIFNIANQVADTTIVLGSPQARHIREIKTYAISLEEIIKPEPGAIYRVEIRGREPLIEEKFYDSDYSFGDWSTYDVRCVDLLASDLALIVKGGDKSYEIRAFDILSGKPVSGAKVKLFDQAQQELAKGSTDGDGKIVLPAKTGTRFATASYYDNFAYLDLKNEKSLSTSSFNVGGTTHKDGINAFIFGERGVWRPGDTLHVSVIASLQDAGLPDDHPIIARLRNPDGQVTQTITRHKAEGPIFHFPFTTQKDATTGRWQADVIIGGQTFSKGLRVETVKPNKIDISLSFDGRKVLAPDAGCTGEIAANWLYGAAAANLKTETSLELSTAKTAFKNFESFDFKDDTKEFGSQTLNYGEMTTDENGRCHINTGIKLDKNNVPGLLDAVFTTRVYEQTGEFSTGVSKFKMSAFDSYVGIRTELDKSEWDGNFILRGKSHKFDLATVDPEGKPVQSADVHVEIYLVDWSWWWNSASEIASYMSGSSKELVYDKHVSTTGGLGSFSYDWKDATPGLYFIRATEKGGHSTSMLCEVHDRYGNDEVADAATKLSIRCDKEKYTVGQTARICFPSAAGTRALVSIEKGGKLLTSQLVSCFAGSTEVQVPVTRDMLPNAYAHITLIQPYGNVENDAPIRMYGITDIEVEDESSHLHPQISAPDQTRPESRMKLSVSEKDGRGMHYVLALVDEGLLSLTGFKTPDAWSSFYEKEALRVRTWDMYDQIIGAYGGHIEQLFAIGGDDEYTGPLNRAEANRFEPVVRYLGPFTLKPGKTATHEIDIPQYIGNLRAMVVATDGSAQGSGQKGISVIKPLMVQATLPRTLCIGEDIQVPVTLIALKSGIGDVKLSIKTDDAFTVEGPASKTIRCKEEGQTIEYFKVRTAGSAGIGHISVTAESTSDKSRQDVEIDILNPAPEITKLQSAVIEAGKDAEFELPVFGTPGSNRLKVELSSIPAINLEGRMDYLLKYPYGCIEQITSAAFPQLYLSSLTACDKDRMTIISRNIEATIRKMQSYRCSDGSLSYWAGTKKTSRFGSIYALHFLQEAENHGWAVPADLKSSLIAYVSSVASDAKADAFQRAYAMFATAAAGKPVRSAMNRMRENPGSFEPSTTWMLAAAYAIDGKVDIAKQICKDTPYKDREDKLRYRNYGSDDRTRALALKTMLLTGQKERAFKLAEDLAASLNNPTHWMSTQATGWSLYAIGEFAGAYAGKEIKASVTADGKSYALNGNKCIVSKDIAVKQDGGSVRLKIANGGSNLVHASVISTGRPESEEVEAASNGIRMDVRYVGMDGSAVQIDSLQRSTSFKACVTVTNTGSDDINDLALSHKFPSGWEIRNDRIYKDAVSFPDGISYQDFRDDRVYSFFNLRPGASVTVVIGLTATYPGTFTLPAVICEAMYDASVSAVVPGGKVKVL